MPGEDNNENIPEQQANTAENAENTAPAEELRGAVEAWNNIFTRQITIGQAEEPQRHVAEWAGTFNFDQPVGLDAPMPARPEREGWTVQEAPARRDGIGGVGGHVTIIPGATRGAEEAVINFNIAGIPRINNNRRAPAPFPTPRTLAPSQLGNALFIRAAKVPRSIHTRNVSCQRCGCAQSQHAENYCKRCGGCDGYVSQDQLNRVYFTEFLRWSKRWLKANNKRTFVRLSQIWGRYRNTGYLQYCGTCDTPIFAHHLSRAIKRQDALQCSICHQCYSCCQCVECNNCHRFSRTHDVCAGCNTCHRCCKCKECDLCHKECGFNYCGFAMTDHQRRTFGGCGYCHNCCECRRASWVPFASFPKPKFHKPNAKQLTHNPSSRYIAAEIEVAALTGNGKKVYEVVRKWGGSTVGDGSLPEQGFEVNTAPAGGNLYIEQVKEICDEIKNQGGCINEKCGLHVHVDARDMNYYELRRLVRVYAAVEDALFNMVSLSRRVSKYCRPCGKKYLHAIEEGRLPYDKIKSDVITSVYQGPSTQDLRASKYHPSRYNALNLHSWFYRKTIECRMFDGSINADEISNWGILWALMIDYAMKNDDEIISREMVGGSLDCLLKVVSGSKSVIKFVNNRIERFKDQAVKLQTKKVDWNALAAEIRTEAARPVEAEERTERRLAVDAIRAYNTTRQTATTAVLTTIEPIAVEEQQAIRGFEAAVEQFEADVIRVGVDGEMRRE